MKSNLLRSAIAAALYSGVATVPLTALAQEAAPDTATLDRIEVTGSRIKRVDAETTQPVQVITRADIEKTGLNNVFDILNNITSSDGSGLSTVTTQTNGSDGSQQVSLRGLGAQRTLVLVDGKRWVTDIDQTVDVSTIPVAIIERIDVLKDGASAIYGSDAIGGVINIVTRKNYEGAQLGLQYGQTAKGDGNQTGVDLTIGARGERTAGVLSLSHTSQDEIFAADREIARVPITGNDFYGYEPSDCAAVLAGAADPAGLGGFCGSASGVWGLFNGAGIPANRALNPNANIQDGIQAGDFIAFNNTLRYNFAPINYLQQPAKRTNLFGYARFDITDNVSAYARTSYTKRTSSQQLAEVPITINALGANGPQWAFAIPASSIFNPFGTQVTNANYRMAVLGPRNNQFDFDIFSIQLGLEGSFSIGDRYFNWELTGQRNDGQFDSQGSNYVNLFNLKNALGPSGYDAASNQLYCGTSYANRILGCTPFNIFGGPTLGAGSQIPGAPAGRRVSAEEVQRMLDYVGYTLVTTSGNTATNYTGNLSGDLFELPGGMVGFAVGFEYRKDSTFNTPDALVSEGGSSTNFALGTRGQTQVTEYFAEIVAPLLRDAALAKELELSLALRKSDYKASGIADADPTDAFVDVDFFELKPGSPTNAKVGLRWKPHDDLLVRASWGETFRAPSALDLFGGVGEGFPAAVDPCANTLFNHDGDPSTPNISRYAALSNAGRALCHAAGVPVGGANQPFGQIRGLFGSSVLLEPESGENYTVGFVYSPSWLEGLDVTMDFWRIKLANAQQQFAVNFILNQCYTALNAGFCPFVQRDQVPGTPNPGAVTVVNSVPFNAASFRTQGIDLGIGYAFETENWGNFRIKSDTTYTDSLEFQALATGPVNEFVGTYPGAPTFEYRSVLTIDWSKGDWNATWTTRYMSDIAENCFTVCNQRNNDNLNHTGGYAVHDLQLGWKAPWDAKIAVGARNLFGREPPLLTNNTFAHSFDAAYDLPGGAYWYAQYRQDF